MYKCHVYLSVMLNQLKTRIFRILKVASCIAVIAFGIPMAYELIPVQLKPDNIWDFSNSVLLIYLTVLVSLITFSSDQSDDC